MKLLVKGLKYSLGFFFQEVEQHTRKLRDKFGVFEHAPLRTHFDPSRQMEQLHMLLPGYDCDGTGQPSPKRSKLPGGGFAVRTYQRFQLCDREAQVNEYMCKICVNAFKASVHDSICQFVLRICKLTENCKVV
jgi:hypothetical protein